MSEKFASKVKVLGVAHIYGLIQKPKESFEEFKARCDYVKFRMNLGV